MESRKKSKQNIKPPKQSTSSLTLLRIAGFPSSAVFFLVPNSLTDKAFVLENERMTSSTLDWGILEKQLVAKQVNACGQISDAAFSCNNNFVEREHIMTIEIKIKKNEMDEFEVQWIEDGKKNEAKTYYTDDEEDAGLTKAAIEKEIEHHVSVLETKTEHFLRELRAEDEDDYHVLSNRLAALMENLRLSGEKMTLWKLHKLCQKIDEEHEKNQSWDGYDIPKSCQDANKECGKCDLKKEARTEIGCTVPVD